MVERLLAKLVCPVLRRVDFRGKGRICRRLSVPSSGMTTIGFPAGLRLQVDLSQSLHRDYYRGLVDLLELSLMRMALAGGGDMIDVGAHIGLYSVSAAMCTPGRVCAFEPTPAARELLTANLALNHVDERVTVLAAAAGSHAGQATLYVPRHGDSAWATLDGDRLPDTDARAIDVVAVDDVVAELALTPVFVKVDVEGGELTVLEGMRNTLALEPILLCEVTGKTAPLVAQLLPGGYRLFRVAARSLMSGPVDVRSDVICNVLAVPAARAAPFSRFL
jgi:FkbM family methyltransferase